MSPTRLASQTNFLIFIFRHRLRFSESKNENHLKYWEITKQKQCQRNLFVVSAVNLEIYFSKANDETIYIPLLYCRVCKQKETKFCKAHVKELPTVISHYMEEENVNGYKMMFDVTYKDDIIDEKYEEKCLDMIARTK